MARSPLVGRHAELAVLRQAVGSASDGGRVLLLRGETGVGKTRLVEELLTGGAQVRVCEDLHLASAAEMEALAERPDGPLVLGTYDDTGLARDHPLRSLRAVLRRTGRLEEVRLGPLAAEETAALVRAVAGEVPDELVQRIHETSGGLPFFVEEVARALDGAGRVPLPESVTDAVLEATRVVREEVPEAVALAAVLGSEVDLAVLADLAGAAAVDQLLDSGLLVEAGDVASFRHPLVAEALHRSVPWSHRRELHRRVAAELDRRRAEPALVAEHWLAAGRPDQARPLLLEAARRCCEVHAWRDAVAHGRRALSLWPVDDPGRVDHLERLADCVEKAGRPVDAIALWEEAAEARRTLGDAIGAARARRRLATAAELGGDLDLAAAARAAAAEAFTDAGHPAEAVVERLALAEQTASRGRPREALGHLDPARDEAEAVGADALRARVLALEGTIRASLGQVDQGVRMARAGLDLAMRSGDVEVVGANYYELAGALLHATDYSGSADTYQVAADYCREQGVEGIAQACLACLSVAVRCDGDWDRALEIAGVLLADPASSEVVRMIATEETALIAALQGGHRRARPMLRRSLAAGVAHGVFGVEVGAAWGLAVVALETQGDARGAVVELLERCARIDDWHFALPALRWAATYAGTTNDRALLGSCQQLLTRAVTHNSAPKVLSVLAHVGAELALLDGAPSPEQFARSVEMLGSGGSRFEVALATYRWGVALAAAGERDAAVVRLVEAYRLARQLRARPLAAEAARALHGLGERVDRRLGRLAARVLDVVALTSRERQVLRLLAEGRTNRAIADELVVSVRTVDMHVRHLLQKLDSTTRTAAVTRAAELGLLTENTATRASDHGNPAAAVR